MEMATLVFLLSLRFLKSLVIAWPTWSGACRTPSSTAPGGSASATEVHQFVVALDLLQLADFYRMGTDVYTNEKLFFFCHEVVSTFVSILPVSNRI